MGVLLTMIALQRFPLGEVRRLFRATTPAISRNLSLDAVSVWEEHPAIWKTYNAGG